MGKHTVGNRHYPKADQENSYRIADAIKGKREHGKYGINGTLKDRKAHV